MGSCFESKPCQHRVTTDGVESSMSAKDIVFELEKRNMAVPAHFSQYAFKVDMETCLESKPCQHHVRCYGVGTRMFANDIVIELEKRNMAIPDHFSRYVFKVDMETCLKSYPCQHLVTNNGVSSNMSANDIVLELEKRNMPVPAHFIKDESDTDSTIDETFGFEH